MGWKVFKDRFGIDKHTVHKDGGKFYIGSSQNSKIVEIDPVSGEIVNCSEMIDFINHFYPQLGQALPSEIIEALTAEDVFTFSKKVYSYENGEIVERLCESTQWPNTTHEGYLMFADTYSECRDEVIEWAKGAEAARIEELLSSISDLAAQLHKKEVELNGALSRNSCLITTYPAATLFQNIGSAELRQHQ